MNLKVAFFAVVTPCIAQGMNLRAGGNASKESAKSTTVDDSSTTEARTLQVSGVGGSKGDCIFGNDTREPGQWLVGPTHTCQCDRNGSKEWVGCVDSGTPVKETPDLNTAQGRRQKFKAEDFVFDLQGSVPESITPAGSIQALTVDDLPALAGQGVSYSLFNIEPCGINLPHHHPRATEMLYVINGQKLRTAFVEENGGRVIVNDIGTGQVTFFPEGLIHYQQNLSCEPATYISALNSEDPGVVTTATQFFQLPGVALSASLNQPTSSVEKLIAGLPAGPAEGHKQCMEKCGLKWGGGGRN